MAQDIIENNDDIVATICRAGGPNETAKDTALGKDGFGIQRRELTCDSICSGGWLRNRPDEYGAALMVEPRVADSQAMEAYDRSQPLDDEPIALPPERVTLRYQLRSIRQRLSKSEYLRKWREANPERARQRNREAAAAHRARKTAAERLRELSHATAFLQTQEYKAARAAQADEIDSRVRKKYPHLHGTGQRRPPDHVRGI